jgi:hypothetical protein
VNFQKKHLGFTYTKNIVPTSENFVWDFVVESNMAETTASLTWDNSYFGAGKEIYLLDVASCRITNMRSVNNYSFDKNHSKNFKVVFGDSDFVKDKLTPSVPVLFDPYPNPTTGITDIQFVLPKAADDRPGTIRIYNSTGEEVSAVNTPFGAGEGQMVWDAGRQPRGMYFIILKTGDYSLTKKIIKE